MTAVSGGLSAAAGDELARDADLPVRRRGEAELPGSGLDASRRSQRRHLDFELAEENLQPRALGPQSVELVTEMDLLHAQTDDDQAAQDEEKRAGQRERERATHPGIPLSM